METRKGEKSLIELTQGFQIPLFKYIYTLKPLLLEGGIEKTEIRLGLLWLIRLTFQDLFPSNSPPIN